MSEKVLDPKDLPGVIIDLGRVEVKTTLVKKEKNVDYGKEKDKKKLYDIIQVKMAKLKLIADYNI